MRRWLLALLLFGLSTTLSQAAGLRFAQVPADGDGPALKLAIWTPCAAAAQALTIGPYALSATRDCPTLGRQLPLVVISHGHGGSLLNHHDLAETLADAGYVVAAIDHPGDTHADMSRNADISSFVERPADIRRLIDYLLTTSPVAESIDADRIGFFGFSRGGYTGLVLAGGRPDFVHANVPCPDPKLPICEQIRNRRLPSQPLARDPRIRAYVLADPLNEFPDPEDLKDVKAPIQLWASELGGDGVLAGTIAALACSLPARPESHVVPGAAHFAFLPPCPASLAHDSPALCTDGAGFDRAAFHRDFNAKALAFFDARLH
ncbi:MULTISPECIES: alpha/beta hydrolase family protein [Burkholderia]|nr:MULTISPECIES: alpha/beta fold hydrolase [Burkholderia]KGE05830.1 dienelactone hydrolase [Burkholderia gladioli]NBI44101.1 dienelactone hydrolase [Burkholderia sp. ISTR5]